jgi:hypothetical protein
LIKVKAGPSDPGQGHRPERLMMAIKGKAEVRRGWHMIDEIDLVPLVVEHHRWQRLCARLEAIADALPEMPTLIEVAALRSQLRDAFSDDDGERGFPFQQLFVVESKRPQVRRLLDRLRDRRAQRAVEAQDLADMIMAEPDGRISADTLGYMLRSVFASCEQSIAMETLALLFIAPERLTAAARALLAQHADGDQPGNGSAGA